MDKFADFVVRRRKLIIVFFLVATVLCTVLQFFVKVNYNMVDYLPQEAQSTKAVEIMDEEFTQAMPNASVMVRDVTITQALEYKAQLASLDGVLQVMWLDDMVDILEPLEVQDRDTVESYYKDGSALFSVVIEDGREGAACAAIDELIGETGALSGEAVDTNYMQKAASTEVFNAVAILVPLVIVLLMLTSSSWIEPVLFLAAIGVSVLINMGTNLIFGEISFLTNSISPILQMAVSLDYAIFLLHSFADNRKKYDDVNEAMRQSVKSSLTTVASSATTTLFGFLALVFMQFTIGADLGICLAKGIILSFICVMVFLPALTLSLYKLIDRTQHRELIPSFKNIGRVLGKAAIPVIVIVAIIAVPSLLGQSRTNFIYGAGEFDPESKVGADKIAIEERFGQSTVMAILVPRGDAVKEQELSAELERAEHVVGVMSYANTVGIAIPHEYVGAEVTEQFYSDNYARIIVYTDTAAEGEKAFAVVENLQDIAQSYYGDSFYTAGQSANLYDMREVVKTDNTRVNLIAIIAIIAVLIVTFRSATLPIILFLTIEVGIWLNLAIPYFSGTSINFIGYLVLSTVQLGATVDYAILLTTHYLENRRLMKKREAIRKSVGETFKSILVSALTLAGAGVTLYLTSSNPSVTDIGMLLGRGTAISFAMVVLFLPAMLFLLDRLIGKTTHNSRFYKGEIEGISEGKNEHETA